MNIPLVVLPEEDCPYLPGRRSRIRAFLARDFSGDVYHDFMNAGFRRSGQVIYQPVCDNCRLCVPIRVPVGRFTPTKSQRRSWRRNADLLSTFDVPEATDEKFDLYCRYIAARHPTHAAGERESFESFLYESPVESIEICHRDQTGQLLGVGICDVTQQSLSTVYFYYEPSESRRSIGTFSAIFEIELARRMNIPYYYLGFWVHGCQAMEYKTSYRPCEILGADGTWKNF